MPYLHWETDHGRLRSAKVIKEASVNKPLSISELIAQVRQNEENARLTHNRNQPSINYSTSTNPPPSNISQPPIRANTPLPSRSEALGNLLRSAASLAVAMDSYVDEKLMFQYLHADPPLQPRRTLDQSYYGALKNTQARDRDQVVYRATTPAGHECEQLDIKNKCLECQHDIKKVPRLIMVDQLWLWILDDRMFSSLIKQLYRH